MKTKTSIQQKMIRALMKRKLAYEKYFKALDKEDHAAQTAYLAIVKTLFEFSLKADAENAGSEAADGADVADAARMADEILKDEYGISR